MKELPGVHVQLGVDGFFNHQTLEETLTLAPWWSVGDHCSWTTILKTSKNDMFVMHVECERASKHLTGWITCMAPPKEASNYSYILSVMGQDDLRITFEGKCASIDNWKDLVIEKGAHFTMPASSLQLVLKNRKNGKKEIPCSIVIKEKRQDVQGQVVTVSNGSPSLKRPKVEPN